MKFTVGVLLFSDREKGLTHHDLHIRCLKSLSHLIGHVQFRFWCNDVCQETLEYIKSKEWGDSIVWIKEKNHLKYPAFREMVHGEAKITTPYFMWFDDDSYLERGTRPDWLSDVERSLQANHMVGSRYNMGLRPGQREWICRQPWYKKVPIRSDERVLFCTGGWWAIRTEVLYQHDWPSPELLHRGGDVMLGALCYQQGYRIGNFREGVRINADKSGRESASARRGYDGPPIGTANHGRGLGSTGTGEGQEVPG